MLKGTAVKMFAELVRPYESYFEPLKQGIKKARMDYTLNEYLSCLLLFSLFAFIISILLLNIIIPLLLPEELIFAYTLAIILSFVISGMTFAFGNYYPSMVSAGLAGKIDRALPFTASYMATSASSGMNPVGIFRVVAMRGGAIGKEASKIYTNTTSLGMNLTDSIQNVAARSPSEKWADLLYSMASVIKTGGSMEAFLRSRTKSLMSMYRRMLQDYAKQVTFYTEIYITLVIVGSLFFIVLTAIMSPLMGSGVLLLQTFLVFFMIPAVSAGFIVLLKGISPNE